MHSFSVVEPVDALDLHVGPGQLLTRSAAVASHSPGGLVGNTPVLWVDAPFTGAGRGFWAKLEGGNPGGSKTGPPCT